MALPGDQETFFCMRPRRNWAQTCLAWRISSGIFAALIRSADCVPPAQELPDFAISRDDPDSVRNVEEGVNMPEPVREELYRAIRARMDYTPGYPAALARGTQAAARIHIDMSQFRTSPTALIFLARPIRVELASPPKV